MDIGKYKLSILPLFEEDLNEIVDYIALQLENPIAAQALADDVERALIERTACAESFEPYHSKFQRELPYRVLQGHNTPRTPCDRQREYL